MKIAPLTFFNFCSDNIPLLRALFDHAEELSEADVHRIIRTAAMSARDPEITWRRLNELQILLPIEPGSDFYVLAQPLYRLLAYLFDEARATTPEVINGYIQSVV